MINNFQCGLRQQLFITALTSLLVGMIAFNIGFISGNLFLDKTVYGNIYASTIEKREFSNLQQYVNSNDINLSNLYKLNAWYKGKNKLNLTIYNEQNLVYPTYIQNNYADKTYSKYFDINFEDPTKEHILVLTDGFEVRSFVYYYAGDGFYYLITLASGILAFIAFLFCFIFLINKKISYINCLKKELDIHAGGQIEYNVTVKGRDELTELAIGIDQMRCSILNHKEKEEKIKSANSELISAISHDLKTSITSLLTYLELIERKKYCDEDQLYYLINRSLNQTIRIKNISDELFEYFFVYATDWKDVDMEIVDADSFIIQALEHYIFALENEGIKTEKIINGVRGKLNVNIELMKRVFDNIYSNLLKYADLGEKITFSYGIRDTNLYVEISNDISPNKEKKEQTNIGLKTCKKILSFHKGTFDVTQESNKFIVQIFLPLVKVRKSQ